MDSINRKTSITQQVTYQVYLRLLRHIRLSRVLHQCLFGYRPCDGSEVYGPYWDWTTLIIRQALQQYLRADHSFLDMGTGHVGVLAIFASLRLGCQRVHAVDCLPDIVASAKKNADVLHLNIAFHCSDLFLDIHECFNLIAFNAPYLDIEEGRNLGILKDLESEFRFSGGSGGGETIARFLRDAPEHLSDDGVIILGVNHYHIPRSTVQNLLSNTWFVSKRLDNRWTAASAYLLHKRHN